jgi:hypothetical protein
MESNVNVLIRVRPMAQNRPDTAATAGLPVLSINEDTDTISLQREKKLKGNNLDFKFNKVLGPDSSQEKLYDCCNLVRDVMEGINCCIIAYGCTSTGKSYAMIGGGLDDIISNIPSTASSNANTNNNSFRNDYRKNSSKPQTPSVFKPAAVIPEENFNSTFKIEGGVDNDKFKGVDSLTSLFASPRQGLADETAVLNTLNTDNDVDLTDETAFSCIPVDTNELELISSEKQIIVDSIGVNQENILDFTAKTADNGRYIDQFDTPVGVNALNIYINIYKYI